MEKGINPDYSIQKSEGIVEQKASTFTHNKDPNCKLLLIVSRILIVRRILSVASQTRVSDRTGFQSASNRFPTGKTGWSGKTGRTGKTGRVGKTGKSAIRILGTTNIDI